MAGKDMEYIAGRDMEYITGERMDAGADCPADSSRAGTDPAGGFETGVSVAQEKLAYLTSFGREVLGPAVCGFTRWLLDRVRLQGTDRLFFLGRDGWLLLQAYRLLAGPEDPPAFYLQVSRRSLRVPLYSRPMSYEEAVSRAGFPASVTFACFLDGLGMDPAACGPLADRYGIGAEEQISRDRLYKDPRGHRLGRHPAAGPVGTAGGYPRSFPAGRLLPGPVIQSRYGFGTGRPVRGRLFVRQPPGERQISCVP